MRITSTLALAFALAGATLAAPALAKEKAPAAKFTPAVQNALAAAQDALKKNDVPTAEAKVAEAKAAIANDDDRMVTGQVEYQVGKAKNDDALAKDGMALMLASNKAPPELQKQLVLIAGQSAYQAKDYRRAEQLFLQAQQLGSAEPNLVPLLVSSMQYNGETLQALNTLNAAIEKQAAAGQPVPADWYQRGITIGYQAKAAGPDMAQIQAATTALTLRWVTSYPTRSNWHDAVTIYIEQTKAPTDVRVDGYRLLRAAGALTGDADYREYAEDVYLRNPNEAKSVLDEGSSKGIVNLSAKNDASEVMGIVKAKVPADQASLPASEKAARASANGKVAVSVADAYVSYGQYAKAIDLYKFAIAKGGVDVPTANLHMGWALALSGDAAGAKQAFASVTGPRKTLADFWAVHLDHPTQG